MMHNAVVWNIRYGAGSLYFCSLVATVMDGEAIFKVCGGVNSRAESKFWLSFTEVEVLEDALGLQDVLEDTFWSPWPWPRSLKSSKIALSSAWGQHYFWTVEISLENARNLTENLQRPFFWFPQVEIAWKKIFEDLFCLKKIFEDLFFRSPKKIFDDLFCFVFGEHLRLCPWSLASSLVSSTPPLQLYESSKK